jgi:hypothetical protein
VIEEGVSVWSPLAHSLLFLRNPSLHQKHR